MLRFHKKYFFVTVILFLVEVVIAIYFHDRFIRPYVGDFLVVILLYYFFKTFLHTSVLFIAIPVLLFACLIEAAQYFHLLGLLGFQNNPVLRTVFGSSFEWSDLLAYTLGITLVLIIERRKRVIKKGPDL